MGSVGDISLKLRVVSAPMPSACDLIDSLSQPSHVCIHSELQACRRLCEACKRWLRDRAHTWLAARSREPVILQYGSDCTPLQYRRRHAHDHAPLAVVRVGRVTSDFLVERLFLMGLDGRPIVLFGEPVKLLDKTQWCHLQACFNLFPCAREAGHCGLCISHHVWDGAVKSSMERLRRQFFAALRAHQSETLGADRATELDVLHWETYVQCKCHEAHNSLKWAMGKWMFCRHTLKQAYIAVESLRNSFQELADNAKSWISSHLQFENADPQCLRELWTLLGARGDWLDTLVSLQLRYVGGRLLVAMEHEGTADVVELVYMCLLHVWRFEKFTDSRWATIGVASRAIVGSIFCGLDSLVSVVMENPKSSSFFLRGFAQCDQGIRKFLCICSASSFVADAVLDCLFEDDRLPGQLPVIRREIHDEISYVMSVGDGVWRYLASICDMSVTTLRDAAIHSALVQGAFINARLREAAQAPWNLLHGNRRENLLRLASQPKPAEPTTAKIWTLLRAEYSLEELENALGLLAEAGWSSTTVEQGHAKASVLLQKHPGYGEDTMRSRSMVNCMSVLTRPSSDQRKIESELRKIARLQAYKPQHFTGRQLYLRHLQETALAFREQGRAVPDDINRRLFRGHGAHWRDMADERRREYELRASAERDKKREEVAARIGELRSEVAQQRARAQAAAMSDGPKFRLSACRLSEVEKAKLNEFCDGPAWAVKRVETLRAEATQPVGHISERWKTALNSFPVPPTAKGRRPEYAAFMAQHREFFASCVVRMFTEPPGVVHHLAFLFAMQKPLLLAFARVEPIEVACRDLHIGDWDVATLQEWEHNFAFLPGDFVYSDEDLFATNFKIEVLPDVVKIQNGRVVSDSDYVSLDYLQRSFAHVRSKDQRRADGDDDGTAPAEPAWYDRPEITSLFDNFLMREGSDLLPPAPRRAPSSESESESDAEGPDDPEAVFHELYEKRLALLGPRAVHADPQFTLSLRGGAWTQAHKGVAYDVVVARASTGIAERFCRVFHMPLSASFSIAAYGEDMAVKLAELWIHKHEWLLELWAAHGEDEHLDLRAAAAPYDEPADVEIILASGHVGARRRLESIRRLPPRGV